MSMEDNYTSVLQIANLKSTESIVRLLSALKTALRCRSNEISGDLLNHLTEISKTTTLPLLKLILASIYDPTAHKGSLIWLGRALSHAIAQRDVSNEEAREANLVIAKTDSDITVLFPAMAISLGHNEPFCLSKVKHMLPRTASKINCNLDDSSALATALLARAILESNSDQIELLDEVVVYLLLSLFHWSHTAGQKSLLRTFITALVMNLSFARPQQVFNAFADSICLHADEPTVKIYAGSWRCVARTLFRNLPRGEHVSVHLGNSVFLKFVLALTADVFISSNVSNSSCTFHSLTGVHSSGSLDFVGERPLVDAPLPTPEFRDYFMTVSRSERGYLCSRFIRIMNARTLARWASVDGSIVAAQWSVWVVELLDDHFIPSAEECKAFSEPGSHCTSQPPTKPDVVAIPSVAKAAGKSKATPPPKLTAAARLLLKTAHASAGSIPSAKEANVSASNSAPTCKDSPTAGSVHKEKDTVPLDKMFMTRCEIIRTISSSWPSVSIQIVPKMLSKIHPHLAIPQFAFAAWLCIQEFVEACVEHDLSSIRNEIKLLHGRREFVAENERHAALVAIASAVAAHGPIQATSACFIMPVLLPELHHAHGQLLRNIVTVVKHYITIGNQIDLQHFIKFLEVALDNQLLTEEEAIFCCKSFAAHFSTSGCAKRDTRLLAHLLTETNSRLLDSVLMIVSKLLDGVSTEEISQCTAELTTLKRKLEILSVNNTKVIPVLEKLVFADLTGLTTDTLFDEISTRSDVFLCGLATLIVKKKLVTSIESVKVLYDKCYQENQLKLLPKELLTCSMTNEFRQTVINKQKLVMKLDASAEEISIVYILGKVGAAEESLAGEILQFLLDTPLRSDALSQKMLSTLVSASTEMFEARIEKNHMWGLVLTEVSKIDLLAPANVVGFLTLFSALNQQFSRNCGARRQLIMATLELISSKHGDLSIKKNLLDSINSIVEVSIMNDDIDARDIAAGYFSRALDSVTPMERAGSAMVAGYLMARVETSGILIERAASLYALAKGSHNDKAAGAFSILQYIVANSQDTVDTERSNIVQLLLDHMYHHSPIVMNNALELSRVLISRTDDTSGIMQMALDHFASNHMWRKKASALYMLGFFISDSGNLDTNTLDAVIPLISGACNGAHEELAKIAYASLRTVVSSLEICEFEEIVDPMISVLNRLTDTTLSAFYHHFFNMDIAKPLNANTITLIRFIAMRGLNVADPHLVSQSAQLVGLLPIISNDPRAVFAGSTTAVVTTMINLLKNPQQSIRTSAAFCLATAAYLSGIEEAVLERLFEAIEGARYGVERSGITHCIARLISRCGPQELERRIPLIVEQIRQRTNKNMTEAYIGLLIYLCDCYGSALREHVPVLLPLLVTTLANPFDTIRDICFRCITMFVEAYGAIFTPLILDPLERAMFHEQPDVRYRATGLLGSLIEKILQNAEECTADGGDLMQFQVLSLERRSYILSAIFLARGDPEAEVRSHALVVWKNVVQSTPRTIRDIMNILLKRLTGLIISDEPLKHEVAYNCLKELCTYYSDRSLEPLLEKLFEIKDCYMEKDSVFYAMEAVVIYTPWVSLKSHQSQLLDACYEVLVSPDFAAAVKARAASTAVSYAEKTAAALNDRSAVQRRQLAGTTKPKAVLPVFVERCLVAQATEAIDFLVQANPCAVYPLVNKNMMMLETPENCIRAICSISRADSEFVCSSFEDIIHSCENLITRFPTLDLSMLETRLSEVFDRLAQGNYLDRSETMELITNILIFIMEQASPKLSVSLPCYEERGHSWRTSDAVVHLDAALLYSQYDKETTNFKASSRIVVFMFIRQLVRVMDTDTSETLIGVTFLPMLMRWALTDINNEVLSEAGKFIREIAKKFSVGSLIAIGIEFEKFISNRGDPSVVTIDYPGIHDFEVVDGLISLLQPGLLNGNKQIRSSFSGLLEYLITSTDLAIFNKVAVRLAGHLIRVYSENSTTAVKYNIIHTLKFIVQTAGSSLRLLIPQLQSTFLKSILTSGHSDNSGISTQELSTLGRAALITLAPHAGPRINLAIAEIIKHGQDPAVSLDIVWELVQIGGTNISAPNRLLISDFASINPCEAATKLTTYSY